MLVIAAHSLVPHRKFQLTMTLSVLRQKLDSDAARFLEQSTSIGPTSLKNDRTSVVTRLLDWSVANEAHLAHCPSDGTDALVGVSDSSGAAIVWRAYPRQSDGGKVCLFPKIGRDLPTSVRNELVKILVALEPSRNIGPTQQLEIGLVKLSSDEAWHRFERALDIALRTTQA